jgi:hypothetical protein
MRRRALLASIGTASLAGCLGAAEVAEPQPCEPGNDSLGSLLDAVTTEEPPRTARVRAVVVHAGYRLVLTDGTGWGVLDPERESGSLDIERGDCVSAHCYLREDASKMTGVARLAVHLGDRVTTIDENPAGEPPMMPSPPEALFDMRSDGNEAIVLQNVGPASVPAGRLQVRNVSGDRELLDTARWSDLTEKAPGDPVAVGDSLRVDWPGEGVLCWRAESGWVEAVTDSWTLE